MANRRVTLKDIAEELQVSVTTVSKAINKHPDISVARRKQIMQLLEERRYVPNIMAKNLRSAKTRFISLIVSDNTNPYYAKVIKGVEAVLSRQGYHTIISNNNENPQVETNLLNEIISINVAGVLITPALGNGESIKVLAENNVPYVLLHRYIDKDHDNYVVADDEKAAYIGTRYLVEKHGSCVGFINANQSISTAYNRLSGYKKALEESGIPFNENFVIENVFNQDDGYKAASLAVERMGNGRFSLLCYSDYIAVGVMHGIREQNLAIPKDVAIMGIDGIEMFSYFYPGLSSVHLPKYELGVKAAELLLEMIEYRNSEDYSESEDQRETRIICDPSLEIKGTA